jgi:hypothetical protein
LFCKLDLVLLLRPASEHDPPTSTSHTAEITGMNHYAWSLIVYVLESTFLRGLHL